VPLATTGAFGLACLVAAVFVFRKKSF